MCKMCQDRGWQNWPPKKTTFQNVQLDYVKPSGRQWTFGFRKGLGISCSVVQILTFLEGADIVELINVACRSYKIEGRYLYGRKRV